MPICAGNNAIDICRQILVCQANAFRVTRRSGRILDKRRIGRIGLNQPGVVTRRDDFGCDDTLSEMRQDIAGAVFFRE